MRLTPFAAPLLLAVTAQPLRAEYTPLVLLGNNTTCVKCEAYHLPVELVARTEPAYAVHSDLPEMFHSNGVLYATFPVLPPFDTYKDGPLGEAMRTQLNHGFTAIDDSFEVFLYHLSEPGGGAAPRRIVLYAINRSDAEATLLMEQVIEGHGSMGDTMGPEIRLARRVFEREFDQLATATIAPGAGAVVAHTIVVAASGDTADATTSQFINGIIRGRFVGDAERALDLAVIAIPGDVPREGWNAAAEALLGTGAKSGETAMDLRVPPPECHLRRVVGVYRNFEVRGGGRFDVTGLPGNDLRFQMALPAVQAVGCEIGRQTGPMLLHPPYVHPETIGNYTIEYDLHFDLHNPSTEPVAVDLRFGKQDASMGLAWRHQVIREGAHGFPSPVRTGWAGAWTKDDRPDNTRSFFGERREDLVTIGAGEEVRVQLQFHIAGTSSLPFQIHLSRE